MYEIMNECMNEQKWLSEYYYLINKVINNI